MFDNRFNMATFYIDERLQIVSGEQPEYNFEDYEKDEKEIDADLFTFGESIDYIRHNINQNR